MREVKIILQKKNIRAEYSNKTDVIQYRDVKKRETAVNNVRFQSFKQSAPIRSADDLGSVFNQMNETINHLNESI
jgi:spore coat protein CotF